MWFMLWLSVWWRRDAWAMAKPYRLAEFEYRLNHVNCFRELCVPKIWGKNLLDIRHDLQCISWAVEEVGPGKMRDGHLIRWRLHQIRSWIFVALHTELLPLDEAMCQYSSCRSCGAWEAMHWSWFCGQLRNYLNLSRTFHGLFIVSVPDWSWLKFFCEFWKVSLSTEDSWKIHLYVT